MNIYTHLRTARAKESAGFTLIEMVVTIAVIAVLVTIAIPLYGTYQVRTKTNVVKVAAQTAESMGTAALTDSFPETTLASTKQKLDAHDGRIKVDLMPNPENAERVCVQATWTKQTDAIPTASRGGQGCPAFVITPGPEDGIGGGTGGGGTGGGGTGGGEVVQGTTPPVSNVRCVMANPANNREVTLKWDYNGPTPVQFMVKTIKKADAVRVREQKGPTFTLPATPGSAQSWVVNRQNWPVTGAGEGTSLLTPLKSFQQYEYEIVAISDGLKDSPVVIGGLTRVNLVTNLGTTCP